MQCCAFSEGSNIKLNPPSVARCHRLTKVSISIKKGSSQKKISYERRAYESVIEKSQKKSIYLCPSQWFRMPVKLAKIKQLCFFFLFYSYNGY